MIDFKYHLVSLTAVLLALSVGLLLGAGPLQGDIGKTLTSQVQQLRADKGILRAQLDDEKQAGSARDSLAQELLPKAVQRRLDGVPVAVLVLPEAKVSDVTQLRRALQLSGAEIGPSAAVNDTWSDPGPAAVQSRLTASVHLAALLNMTPPKAGATSPATDSAQVYPVLSAGLAAALSSPDPRLRAALRQQLAASGLVDLPKRLAEYRHLVVVGGPIRGNENGAAQRQADSYVQAIRALAAKGARVVVADNRPDPASTSGSLVTDLRKDAPDRVSTVDVVALPLGQIAVVWALVELRGGGQGAYGVGADSDGAVPKLDK